MEQLLLVTSCDLPAGIGASLRTDEQTDKRTDGWTHRCDVGNSILDFQTFLTTYAFIFFSKDARLPVQLQRAMAAEAEAAREARAKVMDLLYKCIPSFLSFKSKYFFR